MGSQVFSRTRIAAIKILALATTPASDCYSSEHPERVAGNALGYVLEPSAGLRSMLQIRVTRASLALLCLAPAMSLQLVDLSGVPL